MSYSIGWDSICRICLQEGELRPIFDDDEDISAKIMMCSSIELKKGTNFPEQICENCFADLETAYKFRTNCENSEAILSSFVVTVTEAKPANELVFSTDSGDVYKYRAPPNLKVERIKKLPSPIPTTEPAEESPKMNSDAETEFELVDHNVEYIDIVGEPDVADEEDTVYYIEQLPEDELQYYDTLHKETNENENASSLVKSSLSDVNPTPASTDKPFKNVVRPPNKFISKPELKHTVLGPAEIITKENGKKVYRMKRVFKEETKPMKVCKLCGNEYKYQHALDSHMRRHNNEKPFECDVCGKAFVINFELNRHKRIHSGEKPYKCQYCDRRFSDFGSRIKHERTHTGERPYKCDTCGKAFAYSHVLNSHNLIHTGEKKYHCTTCGKRFTKSHHLKAHLNIHEKNKNKNPHAVKPSSLDEPQYYADVMKVITPSSRPTTEDETELHIIQDGDIIGTENLTILATDDEIDIKEGISMMFEDGTIVQSH